jgi:HPt (histidine-containing phosphotransfer) domain-containing protein
MGTIVDLSEGYDSSQSKISSIKNYTEVSKSAKKLKSTAGNSQSPAIPDVASQLNKVADQQKRYLRNQPTTFDQLFNLLKLANGSGSETSKYLKKKLLETVTKIEPNIKKIISEEALKALGCSQEQTFQGFTSTDLELNPLETLPVGQGIYIPIQSMDIASILKISTTSKVGKVIYEKQTPNVQTGNFLPYGGIRPFPMNKEFNQRLTGSNFSNSYKGEYGKYYQGVSGQDLFDFQYSPTNQFGVDQACYRVTLISKVNSLLTTTGGTVNKIIDFLQDYYGTIKLIDTVDFTATLMNIVSGAISIKGTAGSEEISEQSKFLIFLQRILGLCFDSRREIDVSGISKIAELDGVDETFFEATEVDLRNIDRRINNIQNGIMELIDCDNVQVPVDYETIIDELIEFRDKEDLSTEDQVQNIIDITNTLIENPDWKVLLPTTFDGQILNQEFIRQIPLAVAGSILSPKVLFPIFVLLQVLESEGTNVYNQAVTSANTYTQSANTINGSVNNIINNQVDFAKTFKTFNIQVTSRIGSIFIEQLFQILKKDLINLLKPVITDIAKGRLEKKYLTIQRLVNIALILQQIVKGVDDYRKCKSLVDEILKILNLLSGFAPPGSKIPNALLLLTEFLPGTSPERSTINAIEELQKLGIPTGTLPDGSPNLMLLFNLSSNKGTEKEQAENGTADSFALTAEGIPVKSWIKLR